MNALRLEIPGEFTRCFGKSDDEVRRNASEVLAVAMYQQGKWSLDMATKFIAATPDRFAEILTAHKVENSELAKLKQS